MDRQRGQTGWQEGISVVPSVYRGLAFAIATVQIFLFPWAHQSVLPPVILVAGAGIYSVLKILRPVRGNEKGAVAFAILGVDLAVCLFLVISTGGLYSPFLLYTLAPVLTAALLLDRGITFIITTASAAYVITGHLTNPFYSTRLSVNELSYFLVYIIAASLAAALPYLINFNLRQRLQSEDILRERQRLSREIHDGVAQTLSALRWQTQLLHRRLAVLGIEMDEIKQIEVLMERARQDARESLELLRGYDGNGGFVSHLRGYLNQLHQDSKLVFDLDASDNPPLETPVQVQLLRICQEALTNVRKHSGAYRVEVKVKPVDGHLKVSIADDGCGFDALTYYHDGGRARGHGLAVMQERAESVGGRVRVLSMPGQGTEVQVEVPTDHHSSRWIWAKR